MSDKKCVSVMKKFICWDITIKFSKNKYSSVKFIKNYAEIFFYYIKCLLPLKLYIYMYKGIHDLYNVPKIIEVMFYKIMVGWFCNMRCWHSIQVCWKMSCLLQVWITYVNTINVLKDDSGLLVVKHVFVLICLV